MTKIEGHEPGCPWLEDGVCACMERPIGLWAIFDMDGVLADCAHRVHLADAKQWDDFHALCWADPVRKAETMLLQGWRLLRAWHRVAVITGRTDNHEEMTREWMSTAGLSSVVDELYMRAHGDRRPSEVVKQDILTRSFLHARRRVAFAVEDTPKLVRMYTDLGIPTLQSHSHRSDA